MENANLLPTSQGASGGKGHGEKKFGFDAVKHDNEDSCSYDLPLGHANKSTDSEREADAAPLRINFDLNVAADSYDDDSLGDTVMTQSAIESDLHKQKVESMLQRSNCNTGLPNLYANGGKHNGSGVSLDLNLKLPWIPEPRFDWSDGSPNEEEADMGSTNLNLSVAGNLETTPCRAVKPVLQNGGIHNYSEEVEFGVQKLVGRHAHSVSEPCEVARQDEASKLTGCGNLRSDCGKAVKLEPLEVSGNASASKILGMNSRFVIDLNSDPMDSDSDSSMLQDCFQMPENPSIPLTSRTTELVEVLSSASEDNVLECEAPDLVSECREFEEKGLNSTKEAEGVDEVATDMIPESVISCGNEAKTAEGLRVSGGEDMNLSKCVAAYEPSETNELANNDENMKVPADIPEDGSSDNEVDSHGSHRVIGSGETIVEEGHDDERKNDENFVSVEAGGPASDMILESVVSVGDELTAAEPTDIMGMAVSDCEDMNLSKSIAADEPSLANGSAKSDEHMEVYDVREGGPWNNENDDGSGEKIVEEHEDGEIIGSAEINDDSQVCVESQEEKQVPDIEITGLVEGCLEPEEEKKPLHDNETAELVIPVDAPIAITSPEDAKEKYIEILDDNETAESGMSAQDDQQVSTLEVPTAGKRKLIPGSYGEGSKHKEMWGMEHSKAAHASLDRASYGKMEQNYARAMASSSRTDKFINKPSGPPQWNSFCVSENRWTRDQQFGVQRSVSNVVRPDSYRHEDVPHGVRRETSIGGSGQRAHKMLYSSPLSSPRQTNDPRGVIPSSTIRHISPGGRVYIQQVPEGRLMTRNFSDGVLARPLIPRPSGQHVVPENPWRVPGMHLNPIYLNQSPRLLDHQPPQWTPVRRSSDGFVGHHELIDQRPLLARPFIDLSQTQGERGFGPLRCPQVDEHPVARNFDGSMINGFGDGSRRIRGIENQTRNPSLQDRDQSHGAGFSDDTPKKRRFQ